MQRKRIPDKLAHDQKTTELAEVTTVFVGTRLWKTKHSRRRFQNFRQSYVLSTCRIEIHQSQPLVWPLRHASGLWLVDFDPTCRQHVWLTEILETFPRVFCFPKSRINENGGKIRASRCCCAAVQKGHMTEQLLNKRNQRVCRDKFTVKTAEKSGWFVDLSKILRLN